MNEALFRYFSGVAPELIDPVEFAPRSSQHLVMVCLANILPYVQSVAETG
jgi:hypothetical protein